VNEVSGMPADETQRTILVVEDEPATLAMVSAYLGKAGFTVLQATDAAGMERALSGQGPVDLVLLDLGLPDADGVELVRKLRRDNGPPVVVLTARTDVSDRITGLETGADDYVTKPFHPRELVARLRNVLARKPSGGPLVQPGMPAQYRFRGWTLDLVWRRVTAPDGMPVPLTASEFDLLAVLVVRGGEALSREALLGATGQPGRDVNDRSIDTLVSRVRRKLGDTRGIEPRMIETCHGRGYRFSAPVEIVSGP